MKQYRYIVILMTISCILFTGCNRNRYELMEDKKGRVIRLDKETGEMAILMGDELVKVIFAKDPDPASEWALAKSMDWPFRPIKQIGADSVQVSTSWREGSVLYKFYVAPIPKKYLSNPIPGVKFTVLFYDIAGFELLKVHIDRDDITKIVDSLGNEVGLSANGSVSCSRQIYSSFFTWNLNWRL